MNENTVRHLLKHPDMPYNKMMKERKDQQMTYDSRPDTYKHIAEVRKNLNTVAASLMIRGHVHDDSKLVSPEVEVFDEYTPKLKDAEYGSDEYKGFLKGMGVALEHHYAANDHHPEHFAHGVKDMDLMQFTEMLCDWMAAVKRTKGGDIRKSIEFNRERFGYGNELAQLMLNTVGTLESE